jgi:hypothetical protein
MSMRLKTGMRFWTWIVCAFTLGFVAGVASIFVLEALIS